MTPRPNKQIYLVRLEAPHGQDGIRIVRWALKFLQRKFKLKCLSIEQQAGGERP